MFASEQLEAYADELAPLLPVDDPRIYPVSGGSEAVETALKMARAYHLARGEDRWRVIGRQGSYHGNTRGALDVGGREPLRRPYLPWLGLAGHTLAPYEYRCRFGDTHPAGCGARYADALEQEILASPAGTVAAFVAEPVAGAGLGAAVPPDDYWPAVTEVCRRHGVLVIADEVMTGFGRTGRWFACDHWAVRPDILVLAKGAASGYWPLGLAVASGAVHDHHRLGRLHPRPHLLPPRGRGRRRPGRPPRPARTPPGRGGRDPGQTPPSRPRGPPRRPPARPVTSAASG